MKHYTRPSLETLPKAIVLANGAFPQHSLPLSALNRWYTGVGRLIACDGATNKLLAYGADRLPDDVVGDLDSIAPELMARLSGRTHRISEQETNDLTKAIRYTSGTRGIRRVTLLGASGGREDHALGILALLPTYVGLVDELVMLTDHGYFRLITEPCTVEVGTGTAFSVFCFEPAPLTLIGAEWPLDGAILPQLWCGTLNRASADTIELHPSAPVLLFVTYD